MESFEALETRFVSLAECKALTESWNHSCWTIEGLIEFLTVHRDCVEDECYVDPEFKDYPERFAMKFKIGHGRSMSNPTEDGPRLPTSLSLLPEVTRQNESIDEQPETLQELIDEFTQFKTVQKKRVQELDTAKARIEELQRQLKRKSNRKLAKARRLQQAQFIEDRDTSDDSDCQLVGMGDETDFYSWWDARSERLAFNDTERSAYKLQLRVEQLKIAKWNVDVNSSSLDYIWNRYHGGCLEKRLDPFDLVQFVTCCFNSDLHPIIRDEIRQIMGPFVETEIALAPFLEKDSILEKGPRYKELMERRLTAYVVRLEVYPAICRRIQKSETRFLGTPPWAESEGAQ